MSMQLNQAVSDTEGRARVVRYSDLLNVMHTSGNKAGGCLMYLNM